MPSLFDNIFAGSSGVANSLLSALGITAVITVSGDANYDPATGDELAPDTTDYTVKCAPPEPYNINEIDGTNILQGDVKITIGAANLHKDISQLLPHQLERAEITINDEILQIAGVTPNYSGEQVATYDLQCRRN